ncbi:rhamnan synthesis F family protein [Hydrogenophaga atypica]|uniref:Rhamnan synthesis F family protein n=1 Tax=Hydrogenophaga atypica TaxID=249409 RepID=A0ABW2QEK2_9BURK
MTNSNEPLVSVIVRSMDRPSLADAVGSVARQTYKHIEILVVNAKGGQHSDVAPIAGGRPVRLVNQAGAGLSRSAAANAGLATVQGAYFAFLDDDDALDEDHFAGLLEVARVHTPNTVVYAGIRGVDGDDPAKKVLRVFADEYEPGKLLVGNFIPIHGPLVPAALLAHGARFDESLSLYEDWDFWLQLSRHAPFVLSPKVTGTYTINGTSGVNPMVATPDAVHNATFYLYRKWLPQLQVDDLWDVTRLYHHRNHALYLAHQDKARLDTSLREMETRCDELQQAWATKEEVIERLSTEQAQLRSQLEVAQNTVDAIYRSKSWRLTAPLRVVMSWWRNTTNGSGMSSVKDVLKNVGPRVTQYLAVGRFALHAARHHGGLFRMSKKALAIFQVEGLAGVVRRLPVHRKHSLVARHSASTTLQAPEWLQGDHADLPPVAGVVVVAHVYYPELFEELAQALASIPWPYTLCISVTSPQAEATVKARAVKLPRVQALDVRVVPNRGRDISPVLVEFREAILRGRYLLHVHTKKSMYSGRERMEWRRYLIDGLLGSERRIRHIFRVLTRDDAVGIVYPDTFEGVPYWAHSWLKNRGVAHGLAGRLGLDLGHRNYVDAPMGSMFWARVDALTPLLDLKLSYRDFPEELGQTDGTLQHAVERFFVLAAHHAGFAHRVFLDGEGGATVFMGQGRNNLQHYYAITAQQRIARAGADAKIVSFDIFDTLFVRPWLTPDSLFAYMDDIAQRRWGLAGCARLRKEAEQHARLASSSGDPGMDDIYACMAKLLPNPGLAPHIRALEENLELKALQPRQDVLGAARRLKEQGRRMVLVSDMYLPRAFLQQLLQAHQITCFDEIYVSNAVGLRKDRGDMWAELPRRENVAADDWLHVGDNEHSDLQLPLEAGYRHPVHVMKAADQFFLFNEDAAAWIQPQHWQESLLLGLLANRLFVPGLAHQPVTVDVESRGLGVHSLHDLGYLAFGPVMVAFMAWLMKTSKDDGVTQLLYASREGHLLKQAHELIARYLPTPDAAYFLCSRRAAVFASIVDEASLEPLLKAHFNGTLADFLRLRLGVDDLAAYTERLGHEQMGANCDLPERTTFCRRSLAACLDLLQDAASSERVAYQAYAQEVMGGQRAALVDIGFSGTIQKALSKFLTGVSGAYYFVTVEAAAEVEATGQFAKGCFGQYINAFHSDMPIYQYALLSEAILTAPHGQLVRFVMQDGQPVPQFKAGGVAQAHFSDIEHIHQGALRFLEDVLQTVGDDFEQLAGHHFTANLAIRQLMRGRWKLHVETPVLQVEDNYSGNQEISVFDFYEKKRLRLPGTLDS